MRGRPGRVPFRLRLRVRRGAQPVVDGPAPGREQQLQQQPQPRRVLGAGGRMTRRGQLQHPLGRLGTVAEAVAGQRRGALGQRPAGAEPGRPALVHRRHGGEERVPVVRQRGAPRRQALELDDERRPQLLLRGQRDILLGREVPEEGALGDLHGLDQLVERGLGEAPRREPAQRLRHQRLPGPALLALPERRPGLGALPIGPFGHAGQHTERPGHHTPVSAKRWYLTFAGDRH